MSSPAARFARRHPRIAGLVIVAVASVGLERSVWGGLNASLPYLRVLLVFFWLAGPSLLLLGLVLALAPLSAQRRFFAWWGRLRSGNASARDGLLALAYFLPTFALTASITAWRAGIFAPKPELRTHAITLCEEWYARQPRPLVSDATVEIRIGPCHLAAGGAVDTTVTFVHKGRGAGEVSIAEQPVTLIPIEHARDPRLPSYLEAVSAALRTHEPSTIGVAFMPAKALETRAATVRELQAEMSR
jgi:hypothetical protein